MNFRLANGIPLLAECICDTRLTLFVSRILVAWRGRWDSNKILDFFLSLAQSSILESKHNFHTEHLLLLWEKKTVPTPISLHLTPFISLKKRWIYSQYPGSKWIHHHRYANSIHIVFISIRLKKIIPILPLYNVINFQRVKHSKAKTRRM